ncbi:MAG: heavy-metal-associated domain-containing protein, partial [Rhodocyclaceae bacterium]|nr:heavy-metal-associated domain-containing protein [Rhodocyclaceae bacterium]
MKQQDSCASPCCGAACSTAAAAEQTPVTGMRYRIPAMDCAAEEGEIRHLLATVPGITALHFALGARTLTIAGDAAAQAAAVATLQRAGFPASPLAAADADAGHAQDDHA